MPQCSVKDCGHIASSLGQLRKHYVEAGHPTKQKAAGARGRRGRQPEPVADAEGTLLTKAIDLFANAGTDSGADGRVLRYLITRFAPDLTVTEPLVAVADEEDEAA